MAIAIISFFGLLCLCAFFASKGQNKIPLILCSLIFISGAATPLFVSTPEDGMTITLLVGFIVGPAFVGGLIGWVIGFSSRK